ncbi:ribonucleoside-diphosphate reductase subunit alpha [Luminiphilus sp.]|nr:ribonucleoside-diphosphate reductase subunit alpha [Luminiphilus sp.]MDA9877995.1 ribonucleoside-diphosphate reductase subunit alpha [Luminiphilus sp.]MDC0973536.1 ribonucleoside-diphosphate reductase subunit alpha [Luminiphilus sp.]
MQTGSESVSSTTPATPPITGTPSQTRLAATAPGQMRVIKRNGTVVSFEDSKISVAITKAFLAVEGGTAAASTRIHETVAKLTAQVVGTFKRRMPSGGTIHIEDIQDQVELALMRAGEHLTARDYVIYRESRRQARVEKEALSPESQAAAGAINVVGADGNAKPLDIERIRTIVAEACMDLSDVSEAAIIDEALKNLYDGVTEHELSTSLVITARTMIEQEPNYSSAAARLLLDNLRAEGLSFLNVADSATQSDMETYYPQALKAFISRGIELELLAPNLAEYDLDRLGDAILPERDLQFSYLGLQTLYDRYFIHSNDVRFELPQLFFMRVAMGLATREDDKNARAIEFYQLLSSFDYMSSTPTLFNSGTLRPQLSSCYLTTVPDDLYGIYGAIQDNAMLSKFAGGLGNDWTPVRALGAYIKGTNGKSQGIVPFLKVVNDTAVAVNQGGKRKGAVCAYLETWHMDIEEFVELRKNTGDDRRRTHDMNTANWVPDLFMKRVFEDGDWTLFSPNDVPDLHDLYGTAFEERYNHYEAQARSGELKFHKTLKAQALWRKMLGMIFETGHPWITFKDPCNIRSPQQHCGVVHSSNLCTEITLNTSKDEIAVCNLGSVNLPQHIENGTLNIEKLRKTVTTAIRMLDNVIDINYYSVETSENSNMKHRPIGLGLMGFQDALYKVDVSYASDQAVEFADQTMEAISYFAISASTSLAAERGAYASYEGSLWSQGVFPIDSLAMLVEQRGADYISVNQDSTMDWDALRETVSQQGMRNSNVMAIAPTATIANITGVSQSIEPTYQNLYVKSNLSGEFTVVNPYLVRDLKEHGLWDQVMVNDLKYYDGSVQAIDRIPADLKAKYSTAFEIEPRWLVDSASRRQKWIDQAQSLNLYINNASGKKLDVTYRMAWFSGLKTTYYLRSLAATGTEKSTVNTGQLNAVSQQSEAPIQPAPVPQACSLDDPDCEACQ